MVIAFIIWTLCSVIFAMIGILCIRSKEAVGFFAGCKPTGIKDVKAYNKAVSKLWFVAAIVFELLGIPFLFLEQNSPGFIPVIFGVIIEMMAMMITYVCIESKYKK